MILSLLLSLRVSEANEAIHFHYIDYGKSAMTALEVFGLPQHFFKVLRNDKQWDDSTQKTQNLAITILWVIPRKIPHKNNAKILL